MINQLYPKPTRPAMADNPRRPATQPAPPPAKPPAGPIPPEAGAPMADLGDVPDRYACDIEVRGSINGMKLVVRKRNADVRKLASVVTYLRAQGFVQAPEPLRFDAAPDGAPICPRHGVAMRQREKQGDTWWSHVVLDDRNAKHYCRGYAGPDSPGYEIEEGGRH